MNMVYAVNGEQVTSSVQEDFDKLEQWKVGKETITQTAVEYDGVIVRDNSALKVVDGNVILKDDADLIPDLLVQCDAIRNAITDLNILNGFDWPPSEGVRFYLTKENQMNFTNLFIQSKNNLLTYPKTVWSGVEVFQLQSAQDVEDFYKAATNHVELQLNHGLLAKQAFRTMTRSELEQWISDNSQST